MTLASIFAARAGVQSYAIIHAPTLLSPARSGPWSRLPALYLLLLLRVLLLQLLGLLLMALLHQLRSLLVVLLRYLPVLFFLLLLQFLVFLVLLVSKFLLLLLILAVGFRIARAWSSLGLVRLQVARMSGIGSLGRIAFRPAALGHRRTGTAGSWVVWSTFGLCRYNTLSAESAWTACCSN
jgi:hypothetical protein